ncbi:deoxyribonuclease IV [Candidatus Phytoplasma phoenicium]|uniref:Probable endonuclease 4 n=1 Tax=Candidatus Phytoplasma phoenicium TaxID=198422 RepID=A0A0L0MJU0_9MOLU|nr:deoxyribonuclease IV [Candidatus Phytoplasma phoenicium]KND62613.1 Endonuclease IV [Candidatus Phytoplasma phoenicium]
MIKIGSHVLFGKPYMYLTSLEQALSFGANTFMIYSGAPQNTIRKDLSYAYIPETLSKISTSGIHLTDVVGHAPYIINLANPSVAIRDFSIAFLTKELKRFDKLHISQMVLHPGNAINKNRQQAVQWIAEGINQIFSNTSYLSTKICLETMAGKGNEIGCSFQELKQIIDLINNPKRIAICFDTCHVFDAGYDIQNNFESVINELVSWIDLKYLTVFHINDSKNPLGSKKDRHENIGYGHIGFESLMKIIYHPTFLHVPKILETPYINSLPPYKEEIEMIKNKQFNLNLKK